MSRRLGQTSLPARLSPYFRAHARPAALVAAAVFLGSAASAAFPLLISHGVDTLAGGITLAGALMLAAAIILAGLAGWTFDLIRQRSAAGIIGDILLALRRDAFAAILAQDMAFFDVHPAGALVSRVAADTQTVAAAMQLVLDVSGQLLIVLFVTLVLFLVDIPLALVTVALALLIIAATLLFRRLARRATHHQQQALAALTAHLHESLSGIAVARNFRQERRLHHELRLANDRWYRAGRRVGLLLSGIFPIMLTLAGLGTVAVVYLGGQAVLAHSLTPGEWYLFIQSVALFWDPLTTIASFWAQFQRGLAAGERIVALIDAPPRVRQIASHPVKTLTGRIAFEHVTFRYTDREIVIPDLTLRIEPGETVALVGHTGAGKSSIIRLIARAYEFQLGRIMIDGRDIRTLDLDDYRRHLSIVPQIPILFSGTIADNLRYACPTASDQDIAAALTRLGIAGWLAALPEGLATPVGELGRNLSTGQRQLIALARILLQNPAILLLDEATASVDPITAAQIQHAIDLALRDRTAVVIAHRLPTVRRADRIIVLEAGTIVEQGTHDALLRAGGRYHDLYLHYFRHQSPNAFGPVTSPGELPGRVTFRRVLR